MDSFMLHRERMATIAVTTITITTVGPTTPCVCPAPTAAAIDAIAGAIYPSCCGLGPFSPSSGDCDNLRLYIDKKK
ncbi:hypothetical protein CI102_12378 [Trichoderma harzianum]|nr:hypothetical protein CI102_12378 [Trichoderma harzianum]